MTGNLIHEVLKGLYVYDNGVGCVLGVGRVDDSDWLILRWEDGSVTLDGSITTYTYYKTADEARTEALDE